MTLEVDASTHIPLPALGAPGADFGDIGTSPLYALHAVFSMRHTGIAPEPENVYGMISMVLRPITLFVHRHDRSLTQS